MIKFRATASSGIRNVKMFRVVIYIRKNWCKVKCVKSARWGGMCQRYKNINLNKIQRSNERVSQDKESLERHNDNLQNKRSENSLHSSREFRAVSM